jgi:hypothetical protein
MKRPVLLLSLGLCFVSIVCNAQYGKQFENRGFESWANFGSGNDTNEPVHWHSGMSASGTFSGFLSKQIEPSTHVRPGSSGSKSVRMWPKSVMGVTANGNLTCGRMNAGSMSASGSSNYNYTQRSDSRFNTPINTIPDSLAVWVCFRSASADQNARARAIIHGDADFREVANGTFDPSDKLVAMASRSFKRTSTSEGSYTWRRLSIPFVEQGPCHDPRYILFTITTNEIPGQGGTSDDMYVDDILLIYNPSVRMGAIEKDHFMMGESLTIPFTLEGTMSAENLNKEANQVIAQLSSANGSFSTPIELGRVTTNVSGSFNVTIPSGIFAGEHYRIRLVTTNYPMISEDNGFDISIQSVTELAESEDGFKVYPVPAKQTVHFLSERIIKSIEIYSMSGSLVLSHEEDGHDVALPVDSMAPGFYFVRCRFDQDELVRKFLVN